MRVQPRASIAKALHDTTEVIHGDSHRCAGDSVARVPLQGPLDGGEERFGERDAVRVGREAHVASDCEHGRVLASEEEVPNVLLVGVSAPLCITVAPHARGGA